MRHTGPAMLAALVAAATIGVDAQGSPRRLSATLESFQEVPAISSTGTGKLTLSIDEAGEAIDYELSFSGLVGDVRQAHIHFAQPGVNGGIMLWLCGTATNPGPAGTPACPQSGTVTGTLEPSDIQMTPTGIAPGEFDEVLKVIRSGVGYANVHTSLYPGGEIRGQIRVTGAP